MKTGIHPESHDVKVTCSCGNKLDIVSTLKGDEIRIETCSKCHPFYTGEKRILKTGSVDKFRKRMEKTNEYNKSKETTAKKGKDKTSEE